MEAMRARTGRSRAGKTAGTAAALLLALVAAGPASADPSAPPGPSDAPAFEALREDLERLIEVQESGGWKIDRYEIEEMMPSALMTVCKVPVETRQRALAFYDRRIVALGGPLEKAWAKKADVSAWRSLIFTTRVRALLAEATARAKTECPVYLEPDPAFRGIQSDVDKWSLNLETGGLLQIRHTQGRWTYGGGGVIRALASRGFGRVTLLAGPEFAGGAMLRIGGAGGFVVNYFPAIPVVLRMHQRTWHYDVELAPVALFQADDGRFSYGVRFGLGGGIQARRSRGVIPWAGIAFAYETYFPGARPAAQFLRGGLRVGIVWN